MQFRHVEKSIAQAIVQKLARMVSTLNAAEILYQHGFVQEQATLQRVIDEIQEDVMFLYYADFDAPSTLHKRFLENFFQETFNTRDPLDSTQKSTLILRKKIRKYNSDCIESIGDTSVIPASYPKVSQLLYRAYSGFIHANSPHIMELYGGSPPKFYMRGMKGTSRISGYGRDIKNYYLRGLMVIYCISVKFGNYDLSEQVNKFRKEYEEIAAKTSS